MSARSEALAANLEQANRDAISTIESLTDAQWNATCTGEGWPVGVTAHHLAGAHAPIAGLVQAIAKQQPLPAFTMDMINQGNAQHARDFAHCTKAETLGLLRDGGPAAAAMVRSLTDAELDQKASFVGQEMSAEQAINNILIGHVQQHAASIRATI